MVLASCLKHCESSPGSCDECSTAPNISVDLWTKLIDLSHKPASRLPADTHFAIPQRVEGWVDLGDWLQDGLLAQWRSPIHVLTWPDIEQLRISTKPCHHVAWPHSSPLLAVANVTYVWGSLFLTVYDLSKLLTAVFWTEVIVLVVYQLTARERCVLLVMGLDYTCWQFTLLRSIFI